MANNTMENSRAIPLFLHFRRSFQDSVQSSTSFQLLSYCRTSFLSFLLSPFYYLLFYLAFLCEQSTIKIHGTMLPLFQLFLRPRVEPGEVSFESRCRSIFPFIQFPLFVSSLLSFLSLSFSFAACVCSFRFCLSYILE